jgi:hypothetical protein
MKMYEAQVEYYGKKGMSLLGVMFTRWITVKRKDGTSQSGYEYQFYSLIPKNYSGQDNVQVASLMESLMHVVATSNSDNPIKDFVFHSDNASCFASQDLIPFLYHLNKKLPTGVKISRWLYYEAQTGRGRLDTHFSYLNRVFHSYVVDNNNIVVEEDIYSALQYRGGVAGTTVLLLNGNNIPKQCVVKKFKSKTVKTRATHEVLYTNDSVKIIASSSITSPEVVKEKKLSAHMSIACNMPLLGSFKSPKKALFIPEKESSNVTEPESSPILSSKVEAIRDALLHCGIDQQPISVLFTENNEPIPTTLKKSWAAYPGNSPFKIPPDCVVVLKELYDRGCASKKKKVGHERAHIVLKNGLLASKWDLLLTVTVTKIKAFFQLTPKKMQEAIDSSELQPEDVAQAKIDLLQETVMEETISEIVEPSEIDTPHIALDEADDQYEIDTDFRNLTLG